MIAAAIFVFLFSALGINGSTPVETSENIEQVVHVNPPAPGTSRYQYMPFDVPPGTTRIDISYEYDRAGNANVLDIGLFDQRGSGSDVDARGFRGWSGGRRSKFFVSQDEATPGYLAGSITAGKWHVILGLYKVVPAGVDVRFKIKITRGVPKAAHGSLSPVARRQPDGRARWWSGDLHMHTVHSDGDWTVAELISTARVRGLDFICITDHNTSSHHVDIDRLQNREGPLVLRGEEITTYGGHTNAWGLPFKNWIDFRVRPNDSARMSAIVNTVHRVGALMSINHPFATCGGCAWTYHSAVKDFDAIEVWNGDWDFADDLALVMWDKMLRTGRHITAIGSSDSHRSANMIGQPTTHVFARSATQSALLSAIRRGQVYVTSEVNTPIVTFEAARLVGAKRWSVGDEFQLPKPETIRFLITTSGLPEGAVISLISNSSKLRELTGAKESQVIEIDCGESGYFRLEIRDASKKMLALTNPIWVKVRSW